MANALLTRSAPGLNSIAASTAFKRREGERRLGERRTPARANSTRRAVSSWSRPNGTTTTGTPAASAFWVMPMTSVANDAYRPVRGVGRGRRSARALLPAGGLNAVGSCAAEVPSTEMPAAGESVQGYVEQTLVALALGRAGDEREGIGQIGKPCGAGWGGDQFIGLRRAAHWRASRARVLEALGGQRQQQRCTLATTRRSYGWLAQAVPAAQVAQRAVRHGTFDQRLASTVLGRRGRRGARPSGPPAWAQSQTEGGSVAGGERQASRVRISAQGNPEASATALAPQQLMSIRSTSGL